MAATLIAKVSAVTTRKAEDKYHEHSKTSACCEGGSHSFVSMYVYWPKTN